MCPKHWPVVYILTTLDVSILPDLSFARGKVFFCICLPSNDGKYVLYFGGKNYIQKNFFWYQSLDFKHSNISGFS